MYKIQFQNWAGETITVDQMARNVMEAVTAVHRAFGHMVASDDYAVLPR